MHFTIYKHIGFSIPTVTGLFFDQKSRLLKQLHLYNRAAAIFYFQTE